ncbi:hypothetical protein GK047_27955 [Paenibacillus sp. SYP-B3998]|uniref:Uncharacterized protein n=1 Tax=Paenibacillus sp. SYP-B3998 TaxID=2678564 RepID=A0A6G4A608_9BACL|nr:hypothetical protein [Paenibacillus sp. SYP-B3998]NEW09760.1 hypothetical protein [Paenibacillus sp. SYP-B3998]
MRKIWTRTTLLLACLTLVAVKVKGMKLEALLIFGFLTEHAKFSIRLKRTMLSFGYTRILFK